ncbi:MAG TPA: FecR domain-containing protein [Anaerolineales bacterium]|nr:FecR domain-containing protein [Anaerolineales bacterium]
MISRLTASTFSLLLVTLLVACQPGPATLDSIPTPSPIGTPSPTQTPILALQSPAPSPTPQPESRIATIAETVNTVDSRETADAQWNAATLGQTLPTGGEVITHLESQARVDFSEGTIVRLGPETHFTVTELSGSTTDPLTRLTLFAGELWVVLSTSANNHVLDVETPIGSASVRGSYLSVAYDPNTQSLIASCLEGNCRLINTLGQIDLVAGQESSIFGLNNLPDPPRPMDPERLERWRLFVQEALPLIEPMRQQLEPLWRDPSFVATREARLTLAATFTLQPGLLRTLAAPGAPLPTLSPLLLTPRPGGLRP